MICQYFPPLHFVEGFLCFIEVFLFDIAPLFNFCFNYYRFWCQIPKPLLKSISRRSFPIFFQELNDFRTEVKVVNLSCIYFCILWQIGVHQFYFFTCACLVFPASFLRGYTFHIIYSFLLCYKLIVHICMSFSATYSVLLIYCVYLHANNIVF